MFNIVVGDSVLLKEEYLSLIEELKGYTPVSGSINISIYASEEFIGYCMSVSIFSNGKLFEFDYEAESVEKLFENHLMSLQKSIKSCLDTKSKIDIHKSGLIEE